MMSTITSAHFSILLNGSPSCSFTASRGLRQGDPLSPFLFILTAEGLGRLIKQKVLAGEVKGLNLWGPHLTLSHQQFVDDIMLFFQATLRECKAILDILNTFMQPSGMMVNKGKSNVFFLNTAPQSQRFLTRILGFTLGAFPSKYLGMPFSENVVRTSCWKALLTRIQKHMLNWPF